MNKENQKKKMKKENQNLVNLWKEISNWNCM